MLLISRLGGRVLGVFLIGAAAVALAGSTARANPYASGVSTTAGTTTFYLNEQADNVRVTFNSGAPLNMGSLNRGVHTFPMGSATSFQIQVTDASGPGYTTAASANVATKLQTSDDTNTTLKFFTPRGVAVITDPTNPLFGRIYVSNASAGTTASPTRAVGDGIYLLNPDLTDAVNQGNTARTAGLDFASTASPYRLHLGKDGLYIADWADSTGNVYRTDFNVTTAVPVLTGQGTGFPAGSDATHGSIAAAVTTGSLGAGNLKLFTVDEDLQDDPETSTATQRNSLWRYDVNAQASNFDGTGTRLFTPTIGSASQTMDLALSPKGQLFMTQYRSAGSQAGVYMLSQSGTKLWDSLVTTRALTGNPTANDLLAGSTGIEVSPKGDYAAVTRENGDIMILPLLADGTPDLANRLLLDAQTPTATGGAARDVAFDAAGNLYYVNYVNGTEHLRIFSPGGATIATTGSDGTFSIVPVPEPSSLALAAAAAGGLLLRRRRRQADASATARD